ncbi:hypothetical protein [Marinomonas algicola]|uniref:hypothetical protein n=1 Tax=Marinomonas algicola TaxID=2773454 RepID=UPI00174BF42A|nr:hypothetical protein [Marinomonas algicola]
MLVDFYPYHYAHSEKAIFSAKGLLEGYMNFNKNKPFSIKTIDKQADELHKVGIIVGASIAQEEIAKHCKQSAVEISDITLAPIGFDGFGE